MVVVGVPKIPVRIYMATVDELVVTPDVGSRQHLLARRQARPLPDLGCAQTRRDQRWGIATGIRAPQGG